MASVVQGLLLSVWVCMSESDGDPRPGQKAAYSFFFPLEHWVRDGQLVLGALGIFLGCSFGFAWWSRMSAFFCPQDLIVFLQKLHTLVGL